MLNIGLGICLAAEAVVYEPFAGVDNTLPSDKTFEENFGYKAEFSYPQLSSDQRTIGGGAVGKSAPEIPHERSCFICNVPCVHGYWFFCGSI